MQEALCEGNMSRRDLDETAKAASALAEKLKELEREAAANQHKLNQRLEALSAASGAGSLAVSSDKEPSEATATDEVGLWCGTLVDEVFEAAVTAEERVEEDYASPPPAQVVDAAATTVLTPQQGEDFVLMTDEEYEALRLAKARRTPAKTPAAKCPLPKLPNSPALSRAVVAAGPVSHARWAVLLGVACALDAMTLGKGGEAWVMEWSEQTWIATNACFLLVLYCAMRLN